MRLQNLRRHAIMNEADLREIRMLDGRLVPYEAPPPEPEVLDCQQVLQDMLEDKQSKIPVSVYLLHTAEGREAFLQQFAYIGADAIFAAVSHVWDWLSPPRRPRTIEMGLIAGTGGTGRTAIRKVLMKYLDEMMSVEFEPIPLRSDYATFHQWNDAAMATFTDCNE
jgi:hypothetical protein